MEKRLKKLNECSLAEPLKKNPDFFRNPADRNFGNVLLPERIPKRNIKFCGNWNQTTILEKKSLKTFLEKPLKNLWRYSKKKSQEQFIQVP